MLIFMQNLSNYVSLVLKLHNRECHNVQFLTNHFLKSCEGFLRAALTVHGMAFPVMEFQDQGYKIKKKNCIKKHTQRKLLNFENWTNGEPQ